MVLPEAGELSSLPEALPRDRLHVFVAGPGRGEGIAIAMPNGSWLLVDSCRTGSGATRQLVLRALVRRFGGTHSRVSHMLITHPHTDHVDGFAELLDDLDPDFVGVTGPDPRTNLAREAELPPATGVTTHVQLRRSLKTAFARIQVWDEQHPGGLISLADGARLPATGDLLARVVAPDAEILERWWREGRLPRLLGGPGANDLSAVLELRWGSGRVLLAGDLPVTRNGVPVETGWEHVLDRHAELAGAHVIKIPHHGSIESLHPKLLVANDDASAWIVTAFSPSDLPRSGDDDGLAFLTDRQSPVLLTAPPVPRRRLGASVSGRVSRIGLAELRAALRNNRRFPVGCETLIPGTGVEPLDPVWYVAIDRRGRVIDRRRGFAALEVRREMAEPPP
jgi:beta-lactamase superfamily II metal-dependent hydrolase